MFEVGTLPSESFSSETSSQSNLWHFPSLSNAQNPFNKKKKNFCLWTMHTHWGELDGESEHSKLENGNLSKFFFFAKSVKLFSESLKMVRWCWVDLFRVRSRFWSRKAGIDWEWKRTQVRFWVQFDRNRTIRPNIPFQFWEKRFTKNDR
jgi:hypothetical protein